MTGHDHGAENIFAGLLQDVDDEATISFGDEGEELTELTEVSENQRSPAPSKSDSPPDFTDLFDEPRPQSMGGIPGFEQSLNQQEMTEGFKKRDVLLTEKPQPLFNNQNYYNILLSGEGELSKRVHGLLGNFLKASDPQDRSMHRGRLAPAYWDLAASIAGKITQKIPIPKQLLLRYGILLPTAISPEQRMLISRIPFKRDGDEPVFYADEWLRAVAFGQVTASATDETKISSKNRNERFTMLMEKTQGRYEAQLQVVRNYLSDMTNQERLLKDQVELLTRHDLIQEYGNIPGPYSDQQRSSLSEMNNILRRLNNLNRQVSTAYGELDHIRDQLEKLRMEENEGDESAVADSKSIGEEMNTIRQMAKLCVGRQGNHFPMLIKQYFIPAIRDIGSRENVINTLAEVEYLDQDVFKRTFKQQTNRIVPNVVLIPCYGDMGICWEPFERHARATSRGRLAIPMYPKDLRVAIIAALGDLRWQVAKERAQHYWMEEGLTGWYYQDFTEKKKKGDVKDSFIQDYILWITRESEGTQKLDREVRDIFWRYIPFPQEIKDKLKNRGFVYNELYKKDQNRALSDGY